AILGAMAGNAAGNKLNQVDAVELEIRLDSGNVIAVVQQVNPAYTPGARVRMTQGANGSVNVSLAN
ncbi:MAG: hypothetical protein ACRCUZ_14335, partial [Shewanella sp.]